MDPLHLDTSFLIRALVPASTEGLLLRSWLADGDSVAMCAAAWSEFCCGPLPGGALPIVRTIVETIVPLTGREAERAAVLFNDSGRRRGSMMDCLIAACALEARAPLATSNVADFRRFVPLGLHLAG